MGGYLTLFYFHPDRYLGPKIEFDHISQFVVIRDVCLVFWWSMTSAREPPRRVRTSKLDFHIKEYAKLKSSSKNSKFVDYKSTLRWLDSDSLYQAASGSLYQIHCLVIFIWSMHGDVGGKENCLMHFQSLLPCHDDQANMISHYDQANMIEPIWSSQYDQAIPMDQQINTLRRGPLRGVQLSWVPAWVGSRTECRI